MTPAARVAAAIDILDRYLAGAPAEKALTNWARANRYAGSKDRAAIRDHVFHAIRRKASLAMLGGAETGRGLMIGAVRSNHGNPDEVFSGTGYAPSVLTKEEKGYVPALDTDWPDATRLNYPEWLEDDIRASLADDFETVLEGMQFRAPVFLRVNLARSDIGKAVRVLAQDGIEVGPHPLSRTALQVTGNARAVRASQAYAEGLVELQDAASQAVIDHIGPPTGTGRALDYCAGGGGKSLALASLGWQVTAYDLAQERMKDIPERAARAGVEITVADHAACKAGGPYDLVLVDAPCSGTGAWRRQPEARWSLTPDRIDELCALQSKVLEASAPLVAKDGVLAYATCSFLNRENHAQVAAFAATSNWELRAERTISPVEGADGFYISILEKLQ